MQEEKEVTVTMLGRGFGSRPCEGEFREREKDEKETEVLSVGSSHIFYLLQYLHYHHEEI